MMGLSWLLEGCTLRDPVAGSTTSQPHPDPNTPAAIDDRFALKVSKLPKSRSISCLKRGDGADPFGVMVCRAPRTLSTSLGSPTVDQA